MRVRNRYMQASGVREMGVILLIKLVSQVTSTRSIWPDQIRLVHKRE